MSIGRSGAFVWYHRNDSQGRGALLGCCSQCMISKTLEILIGSSSDPHECSKDPPLRKHTPTLIVFHVHLSDSNPCFPQSESKLREGGGHARAGGRGRGGFPLMAPRDCSSAPPCCCIYLGVRYSSPEPHGQPSGLRWPLGTLGLRAPRKC